MRRSVIIFAVLVAATITMSMVFKPPKKHGPIIDNIKERLKYIDSDFDNIPIYEGHSSYTENKTVVYICLKDPKTGKYYDMNTLMYVALHELAHVLSKNYGHDEEFKENFENLLTLAEKKGLYNRNIPMPTTYCGIDS